jgi:multidrug efflux pump subunit AcrB
MKKVIEFLARHPIWGNVILYSVLGFGLLAFLQMRYSFFPELQTDLISIQCVYPGASPQEIEEGVVLKIEEKLDGIEGIDRVTSVSRENVATVTVEILFGYDLEKALADVKNAVDQINSFPVGIEKPVIFEQKFRSRALSVVLYGKTDLFNLKYIAENLRDEFLAAPEISQVAIAGLPNLEISIEVSEADLRRYELTFDEIAQAVRMANINISGGKFDTENEEILIRAYGRNYYADQLKNLIIRGNPDGTVIYLRDVVDVLERWEDVPDKTYYNGRNSVVLSVDKTADEDILDVANRSKALIERFNEYNDRVQAILLDDRTVNLNQRLILLRNNGLIGLALVILTLGFFMNMRLSFWASLGIPFSFAGMFIVANLVGITVNAISTFGMIIVVGILVDDAIVVAENIFAHYERGKSAYNAAVDGTLEVIAPVFTSVTTTIIAFMPFFFLEGFLGKFIWHMALVVVASLAFSLIEAFVILPSHLAHSKGLHPHKEDPPLRAKIESMIKYITHGLYAPSLSFAMKHKWITLTTPIAFLMVTIGFLGGGFIGITPFPYIDSDTLPINISLVSGTQEEQTDSLLADIERICWQVNTEMMKEREDGEAIILGIRREIGRNDFGQSGSHTGKLLLELLDGESRNMESFLISQRLRSAVGTIPQAQNITFGQQGFFGKPISVSLLGIDLDQLNRGRDLLVAEFENFSPLKDITDSNQEGRKELDITLKPRAHALGLSLQQVAGQVRQGFFGQEVQRIQRGRDELRIWVRYRPEDRAALGFLDQMRIRTPGGSEYPFSELASYTINRGLTAINHLDKKREVKVEANLADETADQPPIIQEIQNIIVPRVLAQVQGVQVSYEGQSRNRAKEAQSMQRVFPLALLGMLLMLILVFRSYAQALLIFSLIPLGVIGAILGHGIQGVQLSFLSIYGIIALSGIIINDSIVFVDQINRNLRSGEKLNDAVFNAGIARLRPILLTTLTTAFGLAPIILETSRQAQFLIPMAVSVAYGLLFGTGVLLLVLPAGFLVLNRIRVKAASWIGKPASAESVEPVLKEMNNGFNSQTVLENQK